MKNNNLIKLDAHQFGVEESKAKQLEAVFAPMVEKFTELEGEYEDLVSSKKVSREICDAAKEIRLKYVKVRTGSDKVHATAKARILVESRAIDGVRNIIKYAVTDHETALKEIETYYERVEEERKQKIRDERQLQLDRYPLQGAEDAAEQLGDLGGVGDLADMTESMWKHYLTAVKRDYEAHIEAEKAEAEEIKTREIAEEKERQRIRKENIKLKAEQKRQEIEHQKVLNKQRLEAEKQEEEVARLKAAKLKQEREFQKVKEAQEEAVRKEAAKLEAKIREEKERKEAELSKGDVEKMDDFLEELEGVLKKYKDTFKSKGYKDIARYLTIMVSDGINHVDRKLGQDDS